MKNFKKIILLFLFLCSFLVLSFIAQDVEIYAFNQDSKENKIVILAEVENKIKAGTFQYLNRVIRTAEEKRADYIIIKLDTPGGLLKATEDIVDLILETEITTIVFVNKEGGWAYSAGTFILMSADYAVVHPRASIGAAQPVVMGVDEKGEAGKKMIEGMASWMRTLAETHQRNPETAERFVRENLTLTGQEAKDIEVIDEIAENLDELFLKLNILEPKITKIYLTHIEKFFNFLSHPFLISLFLTIGGLAIIMAVRSGEFEITGIIGIITLLIGFWGMGIIDFTWLGIGLLLFGIFLLMIEIFVEPGFGILGIAGTIAIILGIFTFEAEPFFAPDLFDMMTMMVMGAGLTLCILFIIIGRKTFKAFKIKPKTGSESLIGFNVEVIKELNPRGLVEVDQEIWSAKNLDGEVIKKGEKVKIIKIEGNTVFVKKVE